jgi:uncharacterized membrane protein
MENLTEREQIEKVADAVRRRRFRFSPRRWWETHLELIFGLVFMGLAVGIVVILLWHGR